MTFCISSNKRKNILSPGDPLDVQPAFNLEISSELFPPEISNDLCFQLHLKPFDNDLSCLNSVLSYLHVLVSFRLFAVKVIPVVWDQPARLEWLCQSLCHSYDIILVYMNIMYSFSTEQRKSLDDMYQYCMQYHMALYYM